MRTVTDLCGKVFGKLTVLRFTGGKSEGEYRYSWECRCECGGLADVRSEHLRSGAITTCGCKKRKRNGCTSDPRFQVWSNMVRRCTDPRDKSFKDYGLRGITVSAEWMDPEVFMRDMGPRPDGYTLERLENLGPYEAGNCVWADRTTQANNKRNVPKVTYAGKSKSVAQWAREYGIPAETLRSRLKAGRSLPEAGTKGNVIEL